MSILTLLLFIIMLTAIISIHEFGHYIACKIFGVYVTEFSIGMGNAIYQKKGKETTFSIRMLPIGGYCAMVDTNENILESDIGVDVSKIPFERTICGIARWKRLVIQIAGIVMNLILALLIVSMTYLSIGQAAKSPLPIIATVTENSPAQQAGLMSEDKIIYIELDNGYSIKPDKFGDISDFLLLYESGDIHLTIDRKGDTKNIDVTPIYNDETDSYIMGITSHEYSIEKINIINCFVYGFDYLVTMTKLIFTTLIGLFRGVGLNNLSGPVGIYNATSQAVSLGFESYILLIGVLSLNIGIFNLLPIPALDGGRMVLTLIEMIIRRPIPKKFENLIMTLSVFLFIMLLVFATYQDLLKYVF